MRIYTMTHKRFDPPADQLYYPLHVGREGKEDLGYAGDNTGDNISDLNPFYGELTGVYWVWKNDMESDYIGICHYRRFFLGSDGRLLDEKGYRDILLDHDIIVSPSMTADKEYLAYFGEAHNIHDMEQVGEAIKKLYPEDYEVFNKVMHQTNYYYGNLCVTSREIFNNYAAWLFAILEEAGKNIDVSSYDLYNQRVFGFLSEQLIKVFIEKRKLRPYECTVGITSEKAETKEFKLAMMQLVKQRQIKEAREMFYQYQKIRPDIRLELSDLRGEIPLIEMILYICEQELQQRVEGILSYTTDLNSMITTMKEFLQLLKTGPDGELKNFIGEKKISRIMVMVLLLNVEIKDKEDVLHKLIQIYMELGKEQDAKALKGVTLT